MEYRALPPPGPLDHIKNPDIRALAAAKLQRAERSLATAKEMLAIDHEYADEMKVRFLDGGYDRFFLTRWIGQYLYKREKRNIPLRFASRKRAYDQMVAAIIRTATELDTEPLIHLPTMKNDARDYETVLYRVVMEIENKRK